MIIIRWVFFFPLLCFLNISFAQTEASDLGRLFSSSSERQILNRMRADNQVRESDSMPVLSTALSGVPGDEVVPKKKSPSIFINGLVKQGNRQEVVWINGERIDGSSGPNDVTIYSKGSNGSSVVIGVVNRQAVTLKPGQWLRSDDGSIEESYEADINKNEVVTKP